MATRKEGYTNVTLGGRTIGFFAKADRNGRYPCFLDSEGAGSKGIGTVTTKEEAIAHIKAKFIARTATESN